MPHLEKKGKGYFLMEVNLCIVSMSPSVEFRFLYPEALLIFVLQIFYLFIET